MSLLNARTKTRVCDSSSGSAWCEVKETRETTREVTEVTEAQQRFYIQSHSFEKDALKVSRPTLVMSHARMGVQSCM